MIRIWKTAPPTSKISTLSIKEIGSSPLMHQIDLYTAKYGSSSFSYVWWAWTAYKIFCAWLMFHFVNKSAWTTFIAFLTMLVIWTVSRHTKLSHQKVQFNETPCLPGAWKSCVLLLFYEYFIGGLTCYLYFCSDWLHNRRQKVLRT